MTAGADVTLDDLDRSHHQVMAALRAEAPVVFVPVLNGWVVTTRSEAVAVMRDARTFTVDDPRFSTGRVVGASMLSLDGAEHRRHRDPFVEALRTGADLGAALGAEIQQLADDLWQRALLADTIELRRQVAGPLAVAVVTRALGIVSIDASALLGWYDQIVASVDAVSRGDEPTSDGTAAMREVAAAVLETPPRTGSPLDLAGRRLTAAEVVSNAAVFMFGGIETSEAMTANAFAHVLESGGWADVVGDPITIDAVLDESLRLEPAAARVDRYATCDVELAGARVHAGDLVVVSIAAANRDPSVFEHPDRFQPSRTDRHLHVAFAQGPHACLGARLARAESAAALRAAVHSSPGLELVELGPTLGVVFRKPTSIIVRPDLGWRG